MSASVVAFCQAHTSDGRPCPNPVAAGSAFCTLHSDQDTPQAPFSDADWLVIEDRSAAQHPAPPPVPLENQAPDDELWVEDRLTELSVRNSERDNRLRAELARFAHAAQRLVPPGAEVLVPTARQTQQLFSRMLGPFFPHQWLQQSSAALNPDLWRGAGYVAAYLLRAQANSVQRRLTGDYAIDDFGRDEGFLSVVLPLAQFMYQNYWRVEVTGLDRVPANGAGLLVSNHSGVLPFDGAMIGMAVYNGTAQQRLPRALVASWFPSLPFVSILLQKTGQVQAHPLTAQRLLARDELVIVFPEGIKGVGKPYRDRYQLQRFGRGGFIKVALQTGAPIIPVAVVGAEEIYPMIGRLDPLARLLGMPFFPLTPTWPWLGPLGLAPLPTKWSIDFGEPITLHDYDSRAASNPAVVARLSDQVRMTIQRMLLERLARRRSIFRG